MGFFLTYSRLWLKKNNIKGQLSGGKFFQAICTSLDKSLFKNNRVPRQCITILSTCWPAAYTMSNVTITQRWEEDTLLLLAMKTNLSLGPWCWSEQYAYNSHSFDTWGYYWAYLHILSYRHLWKHAWCQNGYIMPKCQWVIQTCNYSLEYYVAPRSAIHTLIMYHYGIEQS